VEAGLAFSMEGKARAGMGIDTGDFDGSGKPGVAITNFDNEMIGLYRATTPGVFDDVSIPSGIGAASKNTLGFGCMFLDVDLDGALDLAVANGHIDETVRNIRGNTGYAQAPQLFLNRGGGKFHDAADAAGGGFETPKVGRGLAYGDFDRRIFTATIKRRILRAFDFTLRVRSRIGMRSGRWCAFSTGGKRN